MPLTVAVPVEQYWHRVPGGTARATDRTLAAMAAIDEIKVEALAAWHRPSRRPPSLAGPALRGVDRTTPGGWTSGAVRYAPLPRPALYEAWLRTGRPSVESLVGPVDVVWAASMIMPPTTAPTVATVHDLGFLENTARLSRRGRSFFPRVWSVVGERARLIVCPSQVVADDCVRHGIEPDRLRVIPWGVSSPMSRPEDAETVRRRLDLPKRFVLWVGTLEPRKNLPRLVEAMTQIPETALAVVGPDGWNLDGGDVLAPLGERVHRLGIVDDYTLSALYRAATVFAFPSLLEGFGLPVLEAMSHGTPVVTSAVGATAEVAGDGARLVDPLDPTAIAAGIEAALVDDESTEQLVVRGLARARALSWPTTARLYADSFVEAVG